MSAAEKPAPLTLVPAQPASMTVTGNIRISNMQEAIQLADRLAHARGFVPSSMAQNGPAVLAAILTGAELGFGPMESLRSFDMIEGKVSMKAEVMLGRAHRFGHRTKWLKLGDDGTATISITLAGNKEPEAPVSFTRREAEAAGLAGKGNWKKHEPAMLRARAASACIRAHCPEVLGAGVYESESGELTEGEPPRDAVTATVVSETRVPAAAPAKASLSDATTPEELHDLCMRGSEKMRASTGAARDRFVAAITKHANRLGVDVAVALEWAGLAPQAVALGYDPETGEVPPDQEPPA